MIYLFGKFAGIPKLEDQWLPIISSYKKNTGLVPPVVQNEFFNSIFEKYMISDEDAVTIYNSTSVLGYTQHKSAYQKNHVKLVNKLKSVFKNYVENSKHNQNQKKEALDKLLSIEFPSRTIPFKSPFRELLIQYFASFCNCAFSILRQDDFEIVELHSSVPGYIYSDDYSNTMVYKNCCYVPIIFYYK